ncbi:hypothetical protein [Mycoplasmopsis agassizii]|uniref:ABC transmembrane type-1 domain-containing protein n=1 Tax=Mycoplasmopsis agassizii TaxID=33922 RepID=A0ABX4H592_9BACT|nr:hypothetical protein [Mycoplasmopsis agassizii]PAF55028.1 hypothetical protein CJF60_04835 [Mycoplasmopsis agassizii]SMC17506.1 ABC-type phosphate/phosphonate transport system, permease component [Mycoplasmopsis agassizii]
MRTKEFVLNFFKSRRRNHNLRRGIFLSVFVITIILVIVSFIVNKAEISRTGISEFFYSFEQMGALSNSSDSSSNLFFSSWYFIIITLLYSISGTFLGYVFAFFSVYLAAQNLQRKIVSNITKTFIYAKMLLPFILIAFLYSKQLNPFLGTIFFVWWVSWIYLHNSLLPIIEKVEVRKFYSQTLKLENSFIVYLKIHRYKAFEIYVQIFQRIEWMTRFTSFMPVLGVIHAADLVRGFVSGENKNYAVVGVPLIILLVAYVLLELAIIKIVKWGLFRQRDDLHFQNIRRKLINVQIIEFFIFSFFLITTFACLIYGFHTTTTDQWANYSYSVSTIFNASSWDNFNIETVATHIFSAYSQLLASIAIALIFGTLFGILISKQTKTKYLRRFLKLIVYFFRVMPTVVLFFLIRPIFTNTFTTAIFAIAIVQSNVLAIAIRNAIDGFDENKLKNIRIIRRGFNRLYVTYYYVFPSIKHVIVSWAAPVIMYEMFQQFTIMSQFQASYIGLTYLTAGAGDPTILNNALPQVVTFAIGALGIILIGKGISYFFKNKTLKMPFHKNTYTREFFFEKPY